MSYNLLVIRWSGMGDIVMTLPALKWLREHFESCHITYLTDAAFAAIVEKSELADRVEGIDRRGFAKINRFLPAATATLASVLRLRWRKIDIAFDLQGFGETAVLAYLSRAPVRAGRTKQTPLRKWIYNRPILADWEKEHRSRYFLRAVAEACGCQSPATIEPPRIPLQLSLPESALKPIGINIGASTESRRWSEENFLRLARGLDEKGYRVRFFLGPQESFLTEKIRTACLKNNWDFSFHNRMETLIESLAECRLLISNDTGPGHLAAALDLPVITLFSTGDPDNVRPLARHARWFRNKTDINAIAVGEVLEACLELL